MSSSERPLIRHHWATLLISVAYLLPMGVLVVSGFVSGGTGPAVLIALAMPDVASPLWRSRSSSTTPAWCRRAGSGDRCSSSPTSPRWPPRAWPSCGSRGPARPGLQIPMLNDASRARLEVPAIELPPYVRERAAAAGARLDPPPEEETMDPPPGLRPTFGW